MDSEINLKNAISGYIEDAGIAILNQDILYSNLYCRSSLAEVIHKVASKIAQEGYRKILALRVEDRDPEIPQFLESLKFQRQKAMYLFEANLRGMDVILPAEQPEGIKVSSFHEINMDELLIAIQIAFGENPVGFTKDELDDYVSDEEFSRSCSFYASIGKEIVSFVMVKNQKPEVAYIAYLGTLSQWRRQGIGLLLIKNSLFAAVKEGLIKAIGDQIEPDNSAIIKLLEKAGFLLACSQWNMSLDLRQ